MTNTIGLAEALNRCSHLCHSASYNAGWWDNAEINIIPTKLCLIHSEISEAMEGFRKQKMDDKLPERLMIEVELADALIRIFDLAGYLQMDLGGALIEKLQYNEQRADHKREARAAKGGKKF